MEAFCVSKEPLLNAAWKVAAYITDRANFRTPVCTVQSNIIIMNIVRVCAALLLVEIIAIEHSKYGNVWIAVQKGVEQLPRL